ncbi:ATP-binding protein (plasmid) [Brasilonema octagenarum UFV-E1]|uniref:ATP-binding protein n=2 Tax=Brasilonema TaxID=383614 RepID=A0A856MM99_9CYAN|nr:MULTISPECIES: AAA family ATPase [Brasilonema]NMF65722.1 ATP-binding protein [Brasilonema octagenarum UFV-OR1]QDL12565.1 ATP-binding protein [Brasilonema sennae CENA114]QDL18959.1 ATP-binding protein [Brasilonema octagenarum UFV-E1]
MLRFQDYSLLIEKINAGKNIHLWGKQGIGKTFTVRNCLLKDINLESVYLNLEYPFSVDNLFDVIPISLGLYYQQDWQNIVSQLSDGFQKLLVIDNFDRLHSVSETLSYDLFKLQQLAELDNFSLLLISRMPLRYFHFPSFTKCFEELELNENNTWTFGQ